MATYPGAGWVDDGAAERLLAAYVRRKRFEALLLAGALTGGGQPQRQAQGGGFERMMEMLG